MLLTLLRRIPGTKTAEYLCECGVTKVLVVSNVGPTKTRSCGCFRKARNTERFTKHGHKKNDSERTKTYTAWTQMLSRCNDKDRKNYVNYGGRGITVCERWHTFANFLEDMGESPVGLSLDRKDNSRGYCKENCRWATRVEQNNNKRDNVLITHNGITKTQTQWAEEIGVSRETMHWRRKKGWPVEKLLTPRRRPGGAGRPKATPTAS